MNLTLHLGALLFSLAVHALGTETPPIEEEIEHQLVDPEGCPRDREEAAATGRQCLRKCQSDGECISSRKRCLCDGLCGWSCVRPDLHCNELAATENGQFKVTGDHFGAKVQYTCDEGFYMSGPKERVCQGDGSWSDRSPECKRKAMCGVPPYIQHARHNGVSEKDEYDVDSVVDYTCYPGYDASGYSRAKCLFHNGTTRWFGLELRCIPISCGTPGEIENGRREGDLFAFTSRVTYHCLDGYELVGRANRYCQSNGEWSGELPSCRPIECPIPADPPNGRAVYTVVSYNSVVKYECRYGYRLAGQVTRTCGPNKQWEGDDPICEDIDCGSPGELYNGRLKTTSTKLGSVILFGCLEGMVMDGVSISTTCLQDGTWSHPLPKCLAPCTVPEVEHGRVNEMAPGSKVTHGQHITVDCKPHYDLRYNVTPAVCENGTWTHVPTCVPVQFQKRADYYSICGEDNTQNGLKWKLVNDNTKGTFTCRSLANSRSFLRRHEVTEMTNSLGSGWDGVEHCRYVEMAGGNILSQYVIYKLTDCAQKSCFLQLTPARCKKLPPRPLNGMVIAPKTDHGMKALFRCNDGYELVDGDNVTECHFGRWSGQPPTCAVVYCKFPGYLENGRILLVGHMGMYDYRPYVRKVTNDKQVVYECNRHYMLTEGPSGATCVAGNWSPNELPKCVRGSHPHVRSIRSVRFGRERAIRRLRRQDINRYRRNKIARKKQRGFKDWCPSLERVPWMQITVVKAGKGQEDMPHGTVVRAYCHRGYTLNIGNRTARCARGNWKPMEPQCVTSPCIVPMVKNGIYHHFGLTTNSGSPIPHGELITLKCEAGYQLVGSESPRCWYGEWSSTTTPECIPGPCVLPQIQNGHYLGGYRAGLTISHQSSVDYSCNSDYTKISPETVQCINSQLIPSGPRCNAIRTTSIPAVFMKRRWRVDGELTDAGALSASWRSCTLPKPLKNSLIFNSAVKPSYLDRPSMSHAPLLKYLHGTEILYRCLVPLNGKRISWKITCEDGNWIGRAEDCDENSLDLGNKTCRYRRTDPNLVMFVGGRKMTGDTTEFKPGTEILFRCRDIGKYQLRGSKIIRCRGGRWNGIPPVCYGLSQESDYSLERPPTILFRHRFGEIAQSKEGKLLVYPGTVLHLECLWIRKYGTPHWTARTSSSRKYPEGWTNEPGRDSQLEYRLTIYHAQRSDSGMYTCITPMNQRHSIDILVAAIDCPPVPQSNGLYVSTTKRRMNAKILFQCEDGGRLIGSEKATCLSTGEWSAPFPRCVATECPDPRKIIDFPMQVKVEGLKVGSTARFACPAGTDLRGLEEIVCLDTGQWSAPVPYCTSSPACPYPGTTKGAIISPVKFYYKTSETVIFECLSGYRMKGLKVIQCLEGGKWSSTIPTCQFSKSDNQ